MKSLDQVTNELAAFMPDGRPWVSKNLGDRVTRGLLKGLAGELLRVETSIEELIQETIPDETLLFIDEWERALGIPDDCFSGEGTLDERRRDILAKMAALGVQTAEDMRLLALKIYNVPITITNPEPLPEEEFPLTFPHQFGVSDVESKFTIIINFDDLPVAVTFPYTFALPFLTREAAIIECLIQKTKPANVAIVSQSIIPPPTIPITCADDNGPPYAAVPPNGPSTITGLQAWINLSDRSWVELEGDDTDNCRISGFRDLTDVDNRFYSILDPGGTHNNGPNARYHQGDGPNGYNWGEWNPAVDGFASYRGNWDIDINGSNPIFSAVMVFKLTPWQENYGHSEIGGSFFPALDCMWHLGALANDQSFLHLWQVATGGTPDYRQFILQTSKSAPAEAAAWRPNPFNGGQSDYTDNWLWSMCRRTPGGSGSWGNTTIPEINESAMTLELAGTSAPSIVDGPLCFGGPYAFQNWLPGSGVGGNPYWWHGHLVEMSLYDHDLTAGEVTTLDTYVKNRYGLSAGWPP